MLSRGDFLSKAFTDKAITVLNFVPAEFLEYDRKYKCNGYISLVEIMEIVFDLNLNKKDGSGNYAWEHPRDVAAMGARIPEGLGYAERLQKFEELKNGWAVKLAHDILEDIFSAVRGKDGKPDATNFLRILLRSKLPILEGFVKDMRAHKEEYKKLDVRGIFGKLLENVLVVKRGQPSEDTKKVVEALVRLTFEKPDGHHEFIPAKKRELYHKWVHGNIVESEDELAIEGKYMDTINNTCAKRFAFTHDKNKSVEENILNIIGIKKDKIDKYSAEFENLEKQVLDWKFGKDSDLSLEEKLKQMVIKHGYPLEYLINREQSVANMELLHLRLGYNKIKTIAIEVFPDGAQQFQDICKLAIAAGQGNGGRR